MSKFRKDSSKELPAVSTASLPDIIFILLFFFMVATVMKENDLKIRVKTPQATELEKLEPKRLVSYVYVGKPLPKYASKFGTAPRIQLNDEFATKEQIAEFVANQREALAKTMGEKAIKAMIVSLRVDGEVTMGIVSDVKTALRKANQLKVSYSATQRTKKL